MLVFYLIILFSCHFILYVLNVLGKTVVQYDRGNRIKTCREMKTTVQKTVMGLSNVTDVLYVIYRTFRVRVRIT